jgi:hypothetical protein
MQGRRRVAQQLAIGDEQGQPGNALRATVPFAAPGKRPKHAGSIRNMNDEHTQNYRLLVRLSHDGMPFLMVADIPWALPLQVSVLGPALA